MQMQNTDLVFVPIVCGEWGPPSLGCGGETPGPRGLMISLRAAGKAGVRRGSLYRRSGLELGSFQLIGYNDVILISNLIHKV